jgi:hypothetical protein
MSGVLPKRLRVVVTSTVRHQLLVKLRFAGSIGVILRAKNVATLKMLSFCNTVDLRHMPTQQQQTVLTKRLCRLIGRGERFWNSPTTLSRMWLNDRTVLLRLIMRITWSRIQLVLHEHLSQPRRRSRVPNLINEDFLILGADRAEHCLQNRLPNH